MRSQPPVAIMWFRRDLRLHDNAAFYHALKSGHQVVPLFVFDKNILDQLDEKTDDRVSFLHDVVRQMKAGLQAQGSDLEVLYTTPQQAFEQLLNKFTVKAVFTNRDHEAYALERDAAIEDMLAAKGISFNTSKDQVIFEAREVSKDDGQPYSVFTPFSKRWRHRLKPFHYKSYPCEKYYSALHPFRPEPLPSLQTMGFAPSDQYIPPTDFPKKIIASYDKTRDFPGIPGTSRLSVHLRFGTISIRELLAESLSLNDTYVNELIWRDFYQTILEVSKPVRDYKAWKPAYDRIPWRNNEAEFQKWCDGQTGYPLVDAGMRQMNTEGWMHNRVRMVTASFLCKHLLIDWRWGESYFARKLIDYDYASNNGGWQWAAGSGVDASPYFRIFNPESQLKKFDKDLAYVKKWVPEFGTHRYVRPMVDHEAARKRALDVYKTALRNED